MKYLLSTGELTTRFDEYILDLVKMYTKVFPGDIPGASDYGFNFLFTNVMKEDLETEIKGRVQDLVDKLSKRFTSEGVVISLVSVTLITETKARVILSINNSETGVVEIALTDN